MTCNDLALLPESDVLRAISQYGYCTQCLAAITIPGLDQSHCPGCGWISNSHIQMPAPPQSHVPVATALPVVSPLTQPAATTQLALLKAEVLL